jgi:predicted nucleic acid binding AN1-type Zn finger protein
MSFQDYDIYQLGQKYGYGWNHLSEEECIEFKKHFSDKLLRLGYITQDDDGILNFNNFLFHFYNKERYNRLFCNMNWELFDQSEEELMNNLEFDDEWKPEIKASYYIIKSRINVKENDYFKAISVLEKALELCPDYAEAIFLRGFYRHCNKHYRDSTKDFLKLMPINPLYVLRIGKMLNVSTQIFKYNKKKYADLKEEIKKYFEENNYSEKDLLCFIKRCFANSLCLDYDIALKDFEDLKTIDSNLKHLKDLALSTLKRYANESLNHSISKSLNNFSEKVKTDLDLTSLNEIENEINHFKIQIDLMFGENHKIKEIKRLFLRDTDYNFRSEYYLRRIEVEIRKILLSDKHSNNYKRDNERRKSILNMRSFHLIDDILYSDRFLIHLERDFFLKIHFENEAYIEGGDFAFLGINYGDKKKKITQKINLNSFYICKHQIGRHFSWLDALEELNHRSICEGLTPCYKFNGKETTRYFRREETVEVECNWEADGYRLPTVAEWYYAMKDYEYSTYKYGLVQTEGNEWLWDGVNDKVRLSFDTLYSPHFDKGEYRVITHTNQEVKRYDPNNENMDNTVITNQHYLERNNEIAFRYVRPIHKPEKMTMPYWLKGDKFHFDLRKILKESLYYNGLCDDFPRSFLGYTHSFILSEIFDFIVNDPVEKFFQERMKGLKIIHEEYILFEDLGVEDWNIKIYPQKCFPCNPNRKNHVLNKNLEICRWLIFEDDDNIRYSVLLVNADGVSTHQALYLSNNIRPKFLLFAGYGYGRYYDIDYNNDRFYEYTIYYKDDTVPKYFSHGHFANDENDRNRQYNIIPKHKKKILFYSYDIEHAQVKEYKDKTNLVFEYVGDQELTSKVIFKKRSPE